MFDDAGGQGVATGDKFVGGNLDTFFRQPGGFLLMRSIAVVGHQKERHVLGSQPLQKLGGTRYRVLAGGQRAVDVNEQSIERLAVVGEPVHETLFSRNLRHVICH